MRYSRLALSLGLLALTGTLVMLGTSASRVGVAAEIGPETPPYAREGHSESDWYYSGRWYDEYHGYTIHEAYGSEYEAERQVATKAKTFSETGHSYPYDCDYDYEYDYWQDKYTTIGSRLNEQQILEADGGKPNVAATESQVAQEVAPSAPYDYDYTGGYDYYNYGRYGYDYYMSGHDDARDAASHTDAASTAAEPAANAHSATEDASEKDANLSDNRSSQGDYGQYEYDAYLGRDYNVSDGYGKYADDYTYQDDMDDDHDRGSAYDYDANDGAVADEDADESDASSNEYAEYGAEYDIYGRYGRYSEYDEYYREYGDYYQNDMETHDVMDEEAADQGGVVLEMQYGNHLDPFAWTPSDLLQPADKQLLRTLNVLFEEPGSARETVLNEYFEGLGLDAAEFLARFEEAFGNRALHLHDDLPGVAAVLAAYRMVEQGELGMDAGVETLQRQFNSLSPEWIEDVSFIVTELPDDRGVRTEREPRNGHGVVLQAILTVSTRSLQDAGFGLAGFLGDLTALPGRVLSVVDAARLSQLGTAAVRNWTAR